MTTLTGLLLAGAWVILALTSGYPLFCLLRASSPRPLWLDWVELVFASTLLGSLVIGWIGLLLAEAGLFSLPALSAGLAFILLLAGIGLRMRRASLSPGAVVPSRITWAILLVLILAVILFFHPDEFILGGADAGVYVNLGHNIARTGSLLIREGNLTAIPKILWAGLFRELPAGSVAPYLRFPAFYLTDVATGQITPQFFALHPVWLAIADSLLGLRASLFMNPLWATLGVLALALALKRAFGEHVGLAAAFWLAITPTQIYFARYPTAEPLTQFLTWAGLYAFTAFLADEHPLWGVLAGLALGQVFLARIDALPLLLVPACGAAVALYRHQGRGFLWFLIPLSLMLLHAVFHALIFSFPYTWETYVGVWRLGILIIGRAWWLPAILVACTVTLIWAWRFLPQLAASLRPARWIGAASVIALGLLAYFVWPQTGQTVMAPYWYGDTHIPVQNHLNLVRFGWYFSPLGVGMGIAGIALMFLRANGMRAWPVMVAGLAFSALYFYNIMNNPFHVYAMRRYVPVVFPFFAAGAAYGLVWLGEQRHCWRPAAASAWLLGLMLTGWLAYNNRNIWNLVEYRGLIEQVNTLAQKFEPRSVLLFEDDAPTGAGSTLGTPLQYLHGFTVFDLQEKQVQPAALAAQITDWQTHGRTVYWIKGPHPTDLKLALPLAPVTSAQIHVPVLEQSYDHLPVRQDSFSVPLDIYRVRTATESEACDWPIEIDIGSMDDAYAQRGFYAKERLGDRTVRWTADVAMLELPCIPTLPESITLNIGVSSGRPKGMPPRD